MIIIRIQDILLGILVAMILVHRYVPVDISSLWQYLLVGMVYLIARFASVYVRKYVSFVVLCWGVCEVIIVLLQEWHWISSNHSWFDITGTFGNPGPLGGFLGILCAGIINVIYRRKRINEIRTFSWILIGVLLMYGVIASGSRSGLLAAFTGGVVIFIRRIVYLIQENRIKRVVVECFSTFMILSTVSVILYCLKPDSADGRLLIWLNTLRLISDYPVFGWGTGGWTANYMLYQADFFATHPHSSFIMLADNVAYPYNEILHIGAEHGLLGIALFIWIIIESLRVRPSDCWSESLLTSLWAFIVFSLFSYPFDIFSLLALFAFLVGSLEFRPVFYIRIPRLIHKVSFFIVLTILSGLSVHSYGLYKKAWHDPNLLLYFQYNPDIMYIYSQMETVPDSMRSDILNRTSFLCPDSEIYCLLGDENMEKGNFDKSETYYRKASNMVPSKITPRYKLFRLYVSKGDTLSAVSYGRNILSFKPKIESTRTLKMKGEIKSFLHNYNN